MTSSFKKTKKKIKHEEINKRIESLCKEKEILFSVLLKEYSCVSEFLLNSNSSSIEYKWAKKCLKIIELLSERNKKKKESLYPIFKKNHIQTQNCVYLVEYILYLEQNPAVLDKRINLVVENIYDFVCLKHKPLISSSLANKNIEEAFSYFNLFLSIYRSHPNIDHNLRFNVSLIQPQFLYSDLCDLFLEFLENNISKYTEYISILFKSLEQEERKTFLFVLCFFIDRICKTPRIEELFLISTQKILKRILSVDMIKFIFNKKKKTFFLRLFIFGNKETNLHFFEEN